MNKLADCACLQQGTLMIYDTTLLTEVSENISLVPDPQGVGVFLQIKPASAASRHEIDLGKVAGVERFMSCFRYDPWWMKPTAGTEICQVPAETQFLLVECNNGQYAIFVPIIDEPYRMTLAGTEAGTLTIVADSGDPASTRSQITAAFIALGDDPYKLIAAGANSVARKLGTRLREEKQLPPFMDSFGWCTWDAFYQEVSHEKVRAGLASFVEGGIQPLFLILDDGWQSVKVSPTGESRLTAFAANDKFPGDLATTVRMAKEEYGIEYFSVWHTLQGYWGGVDGTSLPYPTRALAREFGPEIVKLVPDINTSFGNIISLVEPDSSYRFFHDFYRHLHSQGVDGVKVDSQGSLQAVARSNGGYVSLMRTYHEALEGAAQVHFQGNLINCMSHPNEMFYSTLNSNVTRTSTDFWPDQPASHGLHLYTNAQVSMWFGEFVHPDWDMFQSAHPMGPYHAAGRAVAGCPIYVSDKPDGHNFDLLRKMVLSDGTVLRAMNIGRPTRDCLMFNPLTDDVLLKIFNTNDGAGIVGAFNGQYHEEICERKSIIGTISPADVEGLAGEEFVIYAHNTQTIIRSQHAEEHPIALDELSFELYTIVPIQNGIAPIGLIEKFNSAGAISGKRLEVDGSHTFDLRDGGRVWVWCACQPTQVQLNGDSCEFSYDPASHIMEFISPIDGLQQVTII